MLVESCSLAQFSRAKTRGLRKCKELFHEKDLQICGFRFIIKISGRSNSVSKMVLQNLNVE